VCSAFRQILQNKLISFQRLAFAKPQQLIASDLWKIPHKTLLQGTFCAYDEFRPYQQENHRPHTSRQRTVLYSLLNWWANRCVFNSSLVFLMELRFVSSPLISLMKDQVRGIARQPNKIRLFLIALFSPQAKMSDRHEAKNGEN